MEDLTADLQRALCFEDRLRETRPGRCSPSVIISGTIHPLTRRTFSDLRSLSPPFLIRDTRLSAVAFTDALPPLELSKQLSLASFEDWTWKRFAVFNDEETPVVTLERAPLLNLVLSLSFFLSLDINLINSSVYFPYVFLITRDQSRSDHDLVDSSNNSNKLVGLKIKLLHELIHSLKRFLLIDRTSFSYYLRLLLSLFDSNDDY